MSKKKTKKPVELTPEQEKQVLLQQASASIKVIADSLDKAGLDHVINVMVADPATASIDGVSSHIFVGGTDVYKLSGMAAQGTLTVQGYIHGTIAKRLQERQAEQQAAAQAAQEAVAKEEIPTPPEGSIPFPAPEAPRLDAEKESDEDLADSKE